MQVRSMVLIIALIMLVSMAAYAEDQTICVPAPATAAGMGAGSGAGASDVETFNLNFVSGYFDICQATILDLRKSHDWSTIYFVANIASKTGRPVSEIVQLVDQGMSWNDIACRYNMSVADLRQPAPCPGAAIASSGPVGAGPGMIRGSWISDKYGNVVLTQREDLRLKKMGYTWQDIAVASNISMITGDSVWQVLQWTNRGLTWTQITREYGLNPCGCNVLDISCYPFARECDVVPSCAQPCPPVGAGPCPAPCPAPCPNPCPASCDTCPAPCPSACPTAEPVNPCAEPCPAPCPAPDPCPQTCPPANPCPAPCPAPCPTNTCPAGSPNTPSTY